MLDRPPATAPASPLRPPAAALDRKDSVICSDSLPQLPRFSQPDQEHAAPKTIVDADDDSVLDVPAVQQSVAWSCLPREVQVKIFKRLNVQDLLRCCTVSRSWYRLAFDGSLWADLNATPFYQGIPRDQLMRLVSAAGGFLKTANFRGCAQLVSANLITLGDLCPNIQLLSLKGVRGVSANSIEYLLTRLPKLEVLDLSGLAAVNDTVLLSMAAATNDTADKAGHKSYGHHRDERRSHLRSLNLSWCRNVSGKAVAELTATAPQLRHLLLAGCAMLEPPDFSHFAVRVPNLETLDLAYTRTVTDQCMANLLYTLPDGSEVPNTNVGRQKLNHVRDLPMRSLVSLNLIHTQISDVTLHRLARHPCSDTTLRHLQVAGCAQLTSDGLCRLACEATHLRFLDVEDIFQVTDDTLRCFAMHLSQLEHLTLSFCDAITDQGVVAILEASAAASATSADTSVRPDLKLRGLRRLEVDNCWQLTDALLDHLTGMLQNDRIPTLRRLDIFDCRNISWEAVQRVEHAGYTAWRKPSHLRRRHRQRTRSLQQTFQNLSLMEAAMMAASSAAMSPAAPSSPLVGMPLSPPPPPPIAISTSTLAPIPEHATQPLVVKSYYNWQRTAVASRSDPGPDGDQHALGGMHPDAIAARYAAEHQQYARRRRNLCVIL
ncbi:hypothetical protein RI367_004505 [Sorochytrium milnesiophthora]